MRQITTFLTILSLGFSVFGQTSNQLIVTSIVKTDRTFHKKGKLLLENKGTRHQIIYEIDTVNKTLTTHKYIVETYLNHWDGEKTLKEKLKTRSIKWHNKLDSNDYNMLFSSLNTDIDSLEKNLTYLHTSHHYQTIYIDIVQGNDTLSYNKSKPFELLTPWWSNKKGPILNPEIDKLIYNLLPKRFIGRDKLLNTDANITYTQAGGSCFVGQVSGIFEVQFFVGSSVVKIPACV